MNQRQPKAQRYKLPPNVSEETRAQLERAQERLDFFASRPEHRDAYEQEVLNMMTHNTDLEDSFDIGAAVGEEKGRVEGREEGRRESRLAMIKKFRDRGFDDDTIADLLDLTSEDREALLGER